MGLLGSVSWPGGRVLIGRRDERAALDELLEGARAQRSGVLVLTGEAGVGKTALLEHAIMSADDLRVIRVVGVESEMELAFAALHQLSGPLLDLLPRLPDAQREALQVAVGIRPGPGAAPDRFLVGLAVLTLLSEVADQQPLLVVVDDTQWLDRASAEALAFVARRMLAEPIALLFAVREPTAALAGLPQLAVRGVAPADARTLLASVVPGRLDEQIAAQLVAEARGNPLALLELPRTLSPGQVTGGLGLQRAVPARIEDSFRSRLQALPDDTRRLLLLAAADPTGSPALLWRAAETLGITVDALEPAETAGLVEIESRVIFRHPLVRSVLYRAATPQQRREAHHALAEATDPHADPDRHAWHRAHATPWPDETVAAELEHAAERAQARGGLAAAAAYLERAATLTPAPVRRAQRALAAARTKFHAGAIDDALALLDLAANGATADLERARVDLLRAQIAFVARRRSDASPLLLEAARELGPLDPALARETYLEAMGAAMFAGRFAGPGGTVVDIARAASTAAPPAEPRGSDLLLDALAVRFGEGYTAAVPALRQAVAAFLGPACDPDQLRWTWLATVAALQLWDDAAWDTLSRRHIDGARERGALGDLTLAINHRINIHIFSGDMESAEALVQEMTAAAEAIGTRISPHALVALAAVRGRADVVMPLVDHARDEVARRGEGIGLSVLEWAQALFYNGAGHYEQARSAARRVSEHPNDLTPSNWHLPELIEAAARVGDVELAATTHARLAERAQLSDTVWARGIEARCGALVADGEAAEHRHREAIDLLAQTQMRFDLARAHLLYGEWLRQHRRRLDAREQLRAAHELFTDMGAEGFAARAERELTTAGAPVPEPRLHRHPQLTAQETQIARLAGGGLSNAEIGAQLFISRHTVAYHLRKVFSQLEITSRTQLADALESRP
ncbi:MAG: helix-turn-helix transcriptional regulator [Conexibacter sp.]|nr:helix-turn-helix transcriptional regulator [Conexibacter sp.]